MFFLRHFEDRWSQKFSYLTNKWLIFICFKRGT